MPCTNCGNEQVDVYCARCGEKQPGHHDLTVGHFAHEVVHEMVHLDSKLFQTLRELVFRPGFLTAEYFAGRKKRYIAPLRLFLTLFAIQFLAFTAVKSTALYSVAAFRRFDQGGKFTQLIERKAKKHQMTVEQLEERIDQRWHKTMSLLQLVNLLGIALVLKMLYWRRHLVEHLVFSAHFLSFAYLASLLISWPIYAIVKFEPGPLQQSLSALHITMLLVYLYFGQRRFYGQGRGKTALKTALVWGGAYVVTVLILGGSLIAALWHYR